VATIDVQNDFCHPDGAIARMGNDVRPIEEMMSGIHQLLSLASKTGVPVIHVRTGLSEWFDTPAWRARGRAGGVFDAEAVPVVQEGTWGSELYQIEPRDDELTLTKYRYSAFTYTPFELALRAKGCRTLILAGTATHQCVEATGREAMGLGFYPVIVREAVAARSHDQHLTALEDFEAHLGSVVSIDDVADAWKTPPVAPMGEVARSSDD
jgi:ureidoacrylate peracid hydrolase